MDEVTEMADLRAAVFSTPHTTKHYPFVSAAWALFLTLPGCLTVCIMYLFKKHFPKSELPYVRLVYLPLAF